MKKLFFVCTALFMVSCSTPQQPEEVSSAHLEFTITSKLEYGKDDPVVSTLATAHFAGEGDFLPPAQVRVNDQSLTQLSAHYFSLDSPKVPDRPYTVHWFVKRNLGSDIDRELQLPSVLHFLDLKNGDTISASQGAALRHTGSSPSMLKWWIESVLPQPEFVPFGSSQDDDGLLELTPASLSGLSTGNWYRIFIVTSEQTTERVGLVYTTYSLRSKAIMEFYLAP